MTKRRLQHKRRFFHKRIPHLPTPHKKIKSPKFTPPPKSPKNSPSSLKQIKNKSNMNTAPNHPPPITPEKFHINYPIYYEKIINNTFDCYCKDFLQRLINEEKNKKKRIFITEDVLKKFGINNALRKSTLKYLYETLSQYQIHIRYYFKTASIFDFFLIKYSEQNSKENCTNLFLSKHTNTFSETRMILLSLCCFYIANQIHNTINFDLRCLVNWNGKDELSYVELLDLINEILVVIDCETNKITIYEFTEVFLFDITKRLKILSGEENFLEKYNENIIFFSMKFIQDITFLNILPSTQALGIFAFALEYTKYEIINPNLEVCLLVENWTKSLISSLKTCTIDEIRNVIIWCSHYCNTH